MPLLSVQSISELLKVRAKQEAITQKAGRELVREVDSVTLLYTPEGAVADSSMQQLISKAKTLLERYAEQPTLSEMKQHPSWEAGFTWGASFGVSTVVGSLFLKAWGDMFPEFTNVIRSVLLKILEIQHHAGPNDAVEAPPIIDQLLPSMKFTIKDQNGLEVVGEQRDRLVYERVTSLLQVIAAAFLAYGLLEDKTEDGDLTAVLTPLGERVYLHLVDVEQYIKEISTLYPQLKNQVAPSRVSCKEEVTCLGPKR